MSCRLILPDQLPNIITGETYIINLLTVRYCLSSRYNTDTTEHTKFHLALRHCYVNTCTWNKKQFWLLPLTVFTELNIKILLFYSPYL